MAASQAASEQLWADRNAILLEEARRQMQALRRNKKSQSIDVLAK